MKKLLIASLLTFCLAFGIFLMRAPSQLELGDFGTIAQGEPGWPQQVALLTITALPDGVDLRWRYPDGEELEATLSFGMSRAEIYTALHYSDEQIAHQWTLTPPLTAVLPSFAEGLYLYLDIESQQLTGVSSIMHNQKFTMQWNLPIDEESLPIVLGQSQMSELEEPLAKLERIPATGLPSYTLLNLHDNALLLESVSKQGKVGPVIGMRYGVAT